MAHEINTEILINATPEKVWAVLSKFKEYPKWNPFINALSGDMIVGKKIKIVVQGMKIKPELLVYEKNKELRWIGHLLVNGIFDGEHFFILVDNGNGTTTFKHGEKFNGILIPLLKNTLENKLKKSYLKMNEKLKEQVESSK
jgi:hypothetical protein